jgi:hypothetical protein
MAACLSNSLNTGKGKHKYNRSPFVNRWGQKNSVVIKRIIFASMPASKNDIFNNCMILKGNARMGTFF